MPLLGDLAGTALARGDILRLSENYDLRPGSGPVDLMVFDPRDDGCGLGLMVISGYKSGLVLHLLPKASMHDGGGLSVDWLIEHWDDWFVFTYYKNHRTPRNDATVLHWDQRTMAHEL